MLIMAEDLREISETGLHNMLVTLLKQLVNTSDLTRCLRHIKVLEMQYEISFFFVIHLFFKVTNLTIITE